VEEEALTVICINVVVKEKERDESTKRDRMHERSRGLRTDSWRCTKTIMRSLFQLLVWMSCVTIYILQRDINQTLTLFANISTNG